MTRPFELCDNDEPMPVFIVDKPLDLTSHDVVSKARKLLKTRRVGHAGTLDPLASGVLVLLSEDATKLSPFLTASVKHYLAWVSFGASTPTLDAEGPVSEKADASRLDRDALERVLPAFLELTEQIPPAYSAIKKGGVKGYEAARKGKDLDLEARPAGYDEIRLLEFAPSRDALSAAFSLMPDGTWTPNSHGLELSLPETLGDLPTALFYLKVAAGTYVRAFARDLGLALGLPAHLSGLVRTRAGRLGLEEAVALETLADAQGLGLAAALPYPLLILNHDEVARVRQGQRLSLAFEGRIGLTTAEGRLVAVAEKVDERMKLLRVWQ